MIGEGVRRVLPYALSIDIAITSIGVATAAKIKSLLLKSMRLMALHR